MVDDPLGLRGDFLYALGNAGGRTLQLEIQHEGQPAPHREHALRPETCAVYIFSLSESYGRSCPAGRHRVLKVGKAGLNSNARFQSQHYHPSSASSTLAGTLTRSPILWSFLGIKTLDDESVGTWIRTNTDRDNFYLNTVDSLLLGDLERYLRARLGPVVEGG